MKKILLALTIILISTTAQANLEKIVSDNVKIIESMTLEENHSIKFSCSRTFENRDFIPLRGINDIDINGHEMTVLIQTTQNVINKANFRYRGIARSFTYYTKGNILAMCSEDYEELGLVPVIVIVDKSSFDKAVIEYIKWSNIQNQKDEEKRLRVLDKLDSLLKTK